MAFTASTWPARRSAKARDKAPNGTGGHPFLEKYCWNPCLISLNTKRRRGKRRQAGFSSRSRGRDRPLERAVASEPSLNSLAAMVAPLMPSAPVVDPK